MKYTKPPLPLDQQADLLIRRGMAGDRALIIERLGAVGYYRLSGYWFPFRNPDDSFKPNTTFDVVWQRYVFDRRLRLLAMDAIERVEVAVRTQLANHHAQYYKDPFAYAVDPAALPNLSGDPYARFIADMAKEKRTNKEAFAVHFRMKYGTDHGFLPIWMATEVMTFGCLMTLYRGSVTDVRQAVAKPFGVHDTVLESWLLVLSIIRNICAHHGRLWNRQLGVKPKIPTRLLQWHVPVRVGNDRVFGVLTLLKHCLDRVAPQSNWPRRLAAFLDEFPQVPRLSMGFPADWQKCPIWSSLAPPPPAPTAGTGNKGANDGK